MNATRQLVFSLALLALPVAVQAQGWQPIGTPNNDGGQFWDHSSWDGASCNIGYVLTGVAGSAGHACANQRPANWLPYSGEAPTEYAGYADGSHAGFQVGAGTFTFSNLAANHPGGDIAGMNQDWGYLLLGSGTYVSLNSGLPSGPVLMTESWAFWVDLGNGGIVNSLTSPQFAIFGFAGTGSPGALSHWIVGIEDLGDGPGGSDWDYQDMIFGFAHETNGTPQETVPEPATMTLLATGLAGLAASKRRRTKQS